MSISLESLEEEVLKLPPRERSHLLDRLIASLESDTELEAAWAAVAEDRDAELDAKVIESVSGPELVERLRSELR